MIRRFLTIGRTARFWEKMRLSYDLHLPSGDVEKCLPPILLLHGMFDSRKTWKTIAPELAHRTGRKVYTIDARNHGDSPWKDDMSFDILANDVDNFLSQHSIPTAVVVGHSMGGRTALTLALLKPEKVEKLVVEEMSLKAFRPAKESIFTYLIQMLNDSLEAIPPGVDEISARKAVVAHFTSFFPQSKDLIPFYDLDMMPLKKVKDKYSWQANLPAVQDMIGTNKILQTLNGVYMGDALFLYGTKSFFKVDKDTMIPKFFPKATLIGFEGGSHLVHFEYPSRFISEVADFINNNHIKSKY